MGTPEVRSTGNAAVDDVRRGHDRNDRIFTSLTRISDLEERPFAVKPLERDQWATGDYVVGRVLAASGLSSRVELRNGRSASLLPGEEVVGAFGHRFATLEIVGGWTDIGLDGRMDILTGGGLFGRVTSSSDLAGSAIPSQYVGHVFVDGRKATMAGFVEPVPETSFETPVVLIVGTSMSAGKTTTARVVTRVLRELGKNVLGAKFTGAGRSRDVLSMKDAGARHVLDFVDVGLPSTCVPGAEFRAAMRQLLARITALDPDVVVAEAGASPLEPYNGGEAVAHLGDTVHVTNQAASDPYAVLGIVEAFGRTPDLVTGPTTNTEAGIQLVERLTGLPAANVRAPAAVPVIRELMERRLG